MEFRPPQDDKIKKLGKKEKMPAYVYADPDDPTIVYIRTNGVIYRRLRFHIVISFFGKI